MWSFTSWHSLSYSFELWTVCILLGNTLSGFKHQENEIIYQNVRWGNTMSVMDYSYEFSVSFFIA